MLSGEKKSWPTVTVSSSFWRSTVTVFHPCTTWVSAALRRVTIRWLGLLSWTVQDDRWRSVTTSTLCDTHTCYGRRRRRGCVSSRTMKNTVWVTPTRFRRLYKQWSSCVIRRKHWKGTKKNTKIRFWLQMSQPKHFGCRDNRKSKPFSYRGRNLFVTWSCVILTTEIKQFSSSVFCKEIVWTTEKS